MKKLFSVSLVVVMLMMFALAVPTAMASVLIKINDTRDDHATVINLSGPSTVTRVGKEITVPIVDSTMIAAGAANGGAVSMASSTVAVPVTAAHVNMAITTADPAM